MLQQLNPKNKDIKVYIDGELLHRDEAKISVFDSVVQGGDAVWEGIRVYDGRVFHLDQHLERLPTIFLFLFDFFLKNELLLV